MASTTRSIVILVVVLLALGGAIYRYMRASAEQDVQPRFVTAFDKDCTWQCLDCKHSVTEKGGNGPRPCPKCSKESFYVVETWACPTHGVLTVAIKYDQAAKPHQVKVAEGPWISALDEEGDPTYRCSICNDYLAPPQGMPPK